MNAISSPQEMSHAIGQAIDVVMKSVRIDDPYRNFYLGVISGDKAGWVDEIKKTSERSLIGANAIAKAFRSNTRAREFVDFRDPHGAVSKGLVSKAVLDVGTLTNFASITGGQSLGYVSLDTQMARGTVRPNSFTLYQALKKTAAFQVVDYWTTAEDTGAGLPGTAFQSFSSVSTGSLTTSAGIYDMSNITLKLAVNGRAITTALAAQNSFVDVTAQENINAAIAVLESVNWTSYWGNATLYANQFNGIYNTILGNSQASGNVFDFQTFSASYAATNGWTSAQTMFNLIYQAAGQVTGYRNNGRITHAFMSPICAGSLQQLATTLLNNIVTMPGRAPSPEAIIVNGDLQGVKTRFGEIQFPIDLFITARDKPAQAIVYANGTNAATTTAPTKPVSVSAAVSAVTGQWSASYVAASGIYSYAVASTDASMNESTLTFLASGQGVGSTFAISGVGLTTSYKLTITPPVSVDATAFRVYRSGLGYAPTATPNPASYRYIGTVAASGASAVTYTDDNSLIPGSEPVFLLDMDEMDNAIDYRFLLPLTKVELFAQNLFMPWAVCQIGAIRLRIPKFHGFIKNYVPDNPIFNPLAANPNAT